MSCNCQNNNCNPCSQTTPCTQPSCACPVFVASDCVNNVTEDLVCSNILKGQTLTEVLVQLDAYICTKFGSITDFIKIINVGSGAEIYKGDTLAGKKQLRSLVESGLISIIEDTDTITITVDETALNTFIESSQKTYTLSNTGNEGASVFESTEISGDNTQYNLRRLKSSDSSINIVEDGEEIDFTITPADGSETKVTAGTNVSVTGTGTIGDPYIVNSTAGGGGGGTVTSVAALTLGTTGTDLSSSVANGTTTPVITLNVPSASASNRGALTAADWTTFNGKAPLANPTFTGIPAAPTAAPGTNTTQIASTAFVTAAIAASPGGSTTSGTYTPDTTAFLNCAYVSGASAIYSKVGSVVTVSFTVLINDSSASAPAHFDLELPPSLPRTSICYGSGIKEYAPAGALNANEPVIISTGATTSYAEVRYEVPASGNYAAVIRGTFQYVTP